MTTTRLDDPAEHYPYKYDDAVTALAETFASPTGLGGYGLTADEAADEAQALADATQAYIEAQAAHVRNPDDDTRSAYRDAANALVEARRRTRTPELTVTGEQT